MKNIQDQLLDLSPALYKKLSWLRLEEKTPFYNDITPTWFLNFKSALEAISDIQVLGSGMASASEYHIDLAFLKPQAHLDFIHSFYIDGMVKTLFKDNMAYSTQNNIAFHMASVLPPTWEKRNESLNLKAHVLYEIRPDGEKFQAATKEHRNSFDYFQWMLFFPHTCSISAYYDYDHRARHIQTIYMDYDEAAHAKVVHEAQKYPSFFQKRYDYNQEKRIIHKQGMVEYKGRIDQHLISESEFLDNRPFAPKKIILELI